MHPQISILTIFKIAFFRRVDSLAGEVEAGENYKTNQRKLKKIIKSGTKSLENQKKIKRKWRKSIKLVKIINF